MTPLYVSPRRRYLVRFSPKRVAHVFTDVLVIGGGIAGLRAALAIDPALSAIVVTKDLLTLSNSDQAQGGIAGVLDPLDDLANHIADTIAAGKGLCDHDVVEMVVGEAPERIRELIGIGTRFDQDNGRISLTREGGHSHRRIVHADGDATGKEVMRALRAAVEGRSRVQVWEKTFTIDLLTEAGRCRGAIVHDRQRPITCIWAKQTILATGGAGQLFRETTNPEIATADGHAIAFRAGAELRDMEFMQFHPTVLYIAGSSRHLISEAVRGEGAWLRDCHGQRFMPDYNEAAELAPRDVVSQAITEQMTLTRHPCVYLDLTHLDADFVRDRFPHITRMCAEFGVDITCDQVPVRPGAHYMIGGVVVDANGQTTLPGLWSAGEVTSTGLHGANRLASNSLVEGLVYGLRTGREASRTAREDEDDFSVPSLISDWPVETDDEDLNITDLRNALSSLMWRQVGIERTEEAMREAAAQVEFWDRFVSNREFSEVDGWELQNLLLVSQLMIAAACKRTESRGVHLRRDFPETDPAQADHIPISTGDDGRQQPTPA
ncbi:MAG: L-aspartate oxidase [Planctomycetaceae bacterium]|nr:L-aspartate oxidase [Planctomycetaceae bacterium]